MENNEILLNVDNGIGTITLNRAEKKNSFTVNMIDRWLNALKIWRDDPEIKVIMLTGSGDSFCSGVDLSSTLDKQGQDGPYEKKSFLWDKVHRIPLMLEDIDKPVIAVLNGVAVGAGLDMALMCDIRFAADNARFSEGYVKAGMVPGDGGAYYLPRLVGIAKALELLWTGDFIDAEEAHRIGMVNRVYPADTLLKESYTFAKRLADGPGTVIRTIKRATYQSSRIDLRTSLDLISSHMGVIRYTKDSQDALERMTKKHK